MAGSRARASSPYRPEEMAGVFMRLPFLPPDRHTPAAPIYTLRFVGDHLLAVQFFGNDAHAGAIFSEYRTWCIRKPSSNKTLNNNTHNNL